MLNSKNFHPFEQLGDVANLTMPVLYLVGEERELEVSATITYKQLNPNINIGILPFARHLVHKEQPEMYSRILLNFIGKNAD